MGYEEMIKAYSELSTPLDDRIIDRTSTRLGEPCFANLTASTHGRGGWWTDQLGRSKRSRRVITGTEALYVESIWTGNNADRRRKMVRR